MGAGVMRKCTSRLHFRAFKEPSRNSTEKCKIKWRASITKTFFSEHKKEKDQSWNPDTTHSHKILPLLYQVYPSCTGCFAFSSASHFPITDRYWRLTQSLSNQATWFDLFPANLMAFKRELNEAAHWQCECTGHICQSVHQGVHYNPTLNWAAILFSLE